MSVLLLLLTLGGCGGSAPSAPAPSRVDAVKAAPANPREVEAFCDLYATEADAKPFVVPPLAAGELAPTSGWRWVNVWATWCGPCIAEMPTLLAWRDRLQREGRGVDLTFVSFDASDAEVQRFRAKHPEYPLDLRIRDVADIPAWLGAVGLDPGVAIPIHAFVDPAGRLRCVRTGALSDDAFATVTKVLAGG